MAFDASPGNKMLRESQVMLLLGCKTRWSEEQRSRSQLPPYVGRDAGPSSYADGQLRQWIQLTHASTQCAINWLWKAGTIWAWRLVIE